MPNKISTNIFPIAFYNLENLFDTQNNDYTLDKGFTPDGDMRWDEKKYRTKLEKLSNAILKIGKEQTGSPPVFLGVCEVENENALEDLINSEALSSYDYDFVHYESPDERGIDVAFLYQKKYFELIYSDTFPLLLEDENQNRDFTRDILLISGKLFNKQVFIIVNHWPSRNKGKISSEIKRVKAAKLVQEIVEKIYSENKNPKIIIMGDFNDEPKNNSIKNFLISPNFFNPMLGFQEKGKGTTNHLGKWYLFDQIILSDNFKESIGLQYKKAEIVNDYSLQEHKGKRRGVPRRTYLGKHYIGGASDHFPVCVYLKTSD
ncbi:MAG: endonuclease [Bacteroidota bacterium]